MEGSPHVTEPLHDCDYFFDDVVDFGLGGKAADTEPQRGVRHVFRSAERRTKRSASVA